ncbi:MAG: hypothetical protein ACK44E_06895 [Anaerolineales bacterium]
MLGPQSSSDEKKTRLFTASFSAQGSEEIPPMLNERRSSAFLPKTHKWLPRLAQLFKDLIGEPANTNLPDLNQEHP